MTCPCSFYNFPCILSLASAVLSFLLNLQVGIKWQNSCFRICGPPLLARAMQRVIYIVGLTAIRLAFLWDMDKTKCWNGSYIQFRQTFAKETFSYDEHLKS